MGRYSLSNSWVLSRCCTQRGIFRAEHGRGLRWTDLTGHQIKLIRKQHRLRTVTYKLALANHVHELDAD